MNILGMNRHDGRIIKDELDYLKQSIDDIINTPIGSRIMRRNYGCAIMDIIDLPMNEYTLIQIQAQLANTLLQQENNISLTKLVVKNKNQCLFLELEGSYVYSGNKVNINDIKINS